MSRTSTTLSPLLLSLLLAVSAGHVGALCGSSQAASQDVAQAPPVSILSLDVVAIDHNGRVPDDLGQNDFTVTVNGEPRRVLWVRHVSRGPGAVNDAELRQETRAGVVTYAAESVRTVLIVVDQTTLRRGAERATMAAVNAFVDRLGLDDRLGVLRLPLPPDMLIELSTDRPSARDAVRQVASVAVPAAGADVEDVFARPQPDPNRATVVDPDRTGDPERVTPPEIEQPVVSPDATADPNQGRFAVSLQSLQGLLSGLRKLPGRKIVAFFSAGLPGSGPVDIRPIAEEAAAARATVHVFGLEGVRGQDGQTPSLAPFEALAAATGGRSARLDRRPERTIEAILPELSSCYVLGIEAGSPGSPGAAARPSPIRVSVTRKGLTVRAPAYLAHTDDPEDVVPAYAPPPTASPAPAGGTAAGATAAPSAAPRSSTAAEREVDLRRALARMTAYVESYVREYSALVAEEDYYQSAGAGYARRQIRLKSDVLIVRPGDAREWMCFRDIFEVDGFSQGDREDRLKRLFLDPTHWATAELQAIKEESARHNIGPVVRNLNVPLFPLSVLEPMNVMRFRFRFGRKQESDGVERWRIDYEELIRPTLVSTHAGDDVPIAGSFLIDPMTGAVVESFLTADTEWGRAELKVKYRRDADLGFWVPAEMTEYYRSQKYVTLADGRATYSKFRRFQVKTEQTITVPK